MNMRKAHLALVPRREGVAGARLPRARKDGGQKLDSLIYVCFALLGC